MSKAKSAAKPELEVLIDGKAHLLKFDFNAQADVEQQLGLNLLLGDNPFKLGVRGVRAMLWACVRQSEPEVTLEEAGAWINRANLAGVIKDLARVLALGFDLDPEELVKVAEEKQDNLPNPQGAAGAS